MKTPITLMACLLFFVGNAQITETLLKTSSVELQLITECVDFGYYKVAQHKLAASAVAVDTEQVTQRPILSIDQLLQGRVAGLYVSSNYGQPGERLTVGLRGRSSINGSNEPLFILDGVPIRLDSLRILNPNDVDTITVLKDAGANAIYGIRGANGVVVITTKKG